MRNATDHFVYMNSAAKQLVVAIVSKLGITAECVIHVGADR